jgi:tripeptide aminopeptidase
MANRFRSLISPQQPASADSRTAAAELAQMPGVREALAWFQRERASINEQHLALCRVPAPTFLEQKRAEWFVARFAAAGWDASIDRGGNVTAFPAPDRPGQPLVAVTAHLDTVLSPRAPEDITVAADGTIRGAGVSDNGAGLAALLALARVLKAYPVFGEINSADSPVGLVLVANVGEEGEGNLGGMRFLCRQSPLASRIQAYLVLDGPTTDHITWQALASRRFEVTFTGSGGHSWSDHGIGNPIHAMSRAVALFADSRAGVNDLVAPRSSFNFGVVEGGTSVTSIPTSARAKVDLRSESADRMVEMAALLTTSVERALEVENQRAAGSKVSARIREIGSRPGGQLAGDAPILAAIREVDQFLGIRAQLDCASTDANIPLSTGLQALSIGAGGQGGGAHTPAEWFHPDGREIGLRRILLTVALLILRASGNSGGAGGSGNADAAEADRLS